MGTMLETARRHRVRFPLVLAVSAAVGLGGCERESGQPAEPPPKADESPIDFPPAVQSDDPTVNQFVRQITETCVRGDYEEFRLLWSVREDPFPRQEFERGWKALEKVRVLAVQKRKTLEGQDLYYIHTRVELDDSVPEPARDVVLLIVRENDRWRLAKAPAHLRKKVLGVGEQGSTGENSPNDGAPSPRRP